MASVFDRITLPPAVLTNGVRIIPVDVEPPSRESWTSKLGRVWGVGAVLETIGGMAVGTPPLPNARLAVEAVLSLHSELPLELPPVQFEKQHGLTGLGYRKTLLSEFFPLEAMRRFLYAELGVIGVDTPLSDALWIEIPPYVWVRWFHFVGSNWADIESNPVALALRKFLLWQGNPRFREWAEKIKS